MSYSGVKTNPMSEGDSRGGVMAAQGCCAACIVFWLANSIGIASIVIGALHLEECPLEPMIPIYLIVAGSNSFLASTLNVITSYFNSSGQSGKVKTLNGLNSLLSLFGLAWLIAGSVWTYSIWEPNYVHISVNGEDLDVIPYCNKTVYLFSFVSITVTYALVAAGIAIGCCVCCCGGLIACCVGKK